MPYLIIILSLFSAWLCWWIAVRRGRRGTGWFLVGLLLGPVGIAVELIMMKIADKPDNKDINKMAALKSSIALGEQERVGRLLANRQWSDHELDYLSELADLNGQPDIKALIAKKYGASGDHPTSS